MFYNKGDNFQDKTRQAVSSSIDFLRLSNLTIARIQVTKAQAPPEKSVTYDVLCYQRNPDLPPRH